MCLQSALVRLTHSPLCTAKAHVLCFLPWGKLFPSGGNIYPWDMEISDKYPCSLPFCLTISGDPCPVLRRLNRRLVVTLMPNQLTPRLGSYSFYLDFSSFIYALKDSPYPQFSTCAKLYLKLCVQRNPKHIRASLRVEWWALTVPGRAKSMRVLSVFVKRDQESSLESQNYINWCFPKLF